MRVKMPKPPPPAPTASAIGPCPTVIKIVGRPGTGSLPSAIAPPDHPLGRHVVRPWTVPNLGMADLEVELWTWSNMGLSDLGFGLESGPVRGWQTQNWPTILALDLIQTGFDKPTSK